MAVQLLGRRSWSGSRDSEGNRDWKIRWLVKASPVDGPANVMQTPGLAVPGNIWLVDADVDLWAWCRPDMTVSIHQEREGDPSVYWTVDQRFSTKPPSQDKGNSQRPDDQQVEDPTFLPDKINGSIRQMPRQITKDRAGNFVKNYAHQLLKGPNVEFDFAIDIIRIEQNRLNLDFELLSAARNTVNSSPIWGYPARCVKLANTSFSRTYHMQGGSILKYYQRNLEFECWFDPATGGSGWDRVIPNEGTKVLHGRWGPNGQWLVTLLPDGTPPDATNPNHFIAAVDLRNNMMSVPLNVDGTPWDGANPAAQPSIEVEHYPPFDHLLLGIPTSF